MNQTMFQSPTVNATIELETAARRCWDVVVVGAGPAGALAAQQLSKHGAAVLLIDRAAFPRDKACGCCISPTALLTLDRANLSHVISGAGAAPTEAFHVMAGDRSATLALTGGLALSRGRFDAALVRAAIQQGAAFLPRTTAIDSRIVGGSREVLLRSAGRDALVNGQGVIDAGGLGGAIRPGDGQGDHVATRSHIGLRAMLPASVDAPDYRAGTIYMACGTQGYVGLVRLADGRLNVAAAMNVSAVRAVGGAGSAAAGLLDSAGAPPINGVELNRWSGTRQLTRRRPLVGARRLFAIGDAAGYVEPFTGEGIAWALESAHLLTPITLRAVSNWDDHLIAAWQARHRSAFAWRHRRCRAVAWALRRPWVMQPALALLRRSPSVARALVAAIHPTPPDASVCPTAGVR